MPFSYFFFFVSRQKYLLPAEYGLWVEQKVVGSFEIISRQSAKEMTLSSDLDFPGTLIMTTLGPIILSSLLWGLSFEGRRRAKLAKTIDLSLSDHWSMERLATNADPAWAGKGVDDDDDD